MTDLEKGRGPDRDDEGKPDKPKPKLKLVIFINDDRYEVDDKTMTGAELKALAALPAEYQLFLEEKGDDRQIRDDETVKLRKEMKFYSLPPATFG